MSLCLAPVPAAAPAPRHCPPLARSYASLLQSSRLRHEQQWTRAAADTPALSMSAAAIKSTPMQDSVKEEVDPMQLLQERLERAVSDASVLSTDDDDSGDEQVDCVDATANGELQLRSRFSSYSSFAAYQSSSSAASVLDDDESKSECELSLQDAEEEFEESCLVDEEEDEELCSENDIDEEYFDEYADMYDVCARSMYTTPSGRHARKSRRTPSTAASAAPATPRVDSFILRHIVSSRSSLRAACVKMAPRRPMRNATDEGEDREANGLNTRNPLNPYASQIIKTQTPVLQAGRGQRDQWIAQHAAAVDASPRPSQPQAAPAVPTSSLKSQARACSSAARKLPIALHDCRNPKWLAVLEQRAASKTAAAAKKAERPERLATTPRAAKPRSAARASAARSAAALEAKARREAEHKLAAEQKAKLVAELKSARMHTKNQIALKPLAESPLIVTITAARWLSAHFTQPAASSAPSTVPRRASKAKKAALAKRAAKAAMASSRSRQDHDLAPLQSMPCAVQRAPNSPHPSATARRFESFRLRWFLRHREQLQRALHNIQSIRLATPSLSVQATFLARLDALGSSYTATPSFHGTIAANHAPILEHGFLCPGRRIPNTTRTVPVANGSCYGKGVYSSTTAEYSVGFCRGQAQSLFICAVLTKRGSGSPLTPVTCPSVRVFHNILVAFDDRCIIPLFWLDFKAGATSGPAPHVAAPPRTGAQRLEEQLRRADAVKAAERRIVPPTRSMLRRMLHTLYARAKAQAANSKALRQQPLLHELAW